MTAIFLMLMVTTMPTQAGSEILSAKYAGNEDVVRELLKTAVELNIFEAAATGQTDRVRKLVEADRSLVNAYAPDGFFPLGLAVFFGYDEVVEVLLASGADVNLQSREFMKVSALHSATARHRLDLAEALLARGANPNLRAEGGYTPLHGAALSGQRDLVWLLLENGADVNAQDAAGKTALDHAIESRHDAVAALLRERGGKASIGH
jgi:ankyrin repeat protein